MHSKIGDRVKTKEVKKPSAGSAPFCTQAGGDEGEGLGARVHTLFSSRIDISGTQDIKIQDQ